MFCFKMEMYKAMAWMKWKLKAETFEWKKKMEIK